MSKAVSVATLAANRYVRRAPMCSVSSLKPCSMVFCKSGLSFFSFFHAAFILLLSQRKSRIEKMSI